MADCFSKLPRIRPPSAGKSISIGKGKIIAFDQIPKQFERDEIDEAYNYDMEYNVSDWNGVSQNTKSCFILESKNHIYYDEELLDMFVNHHAFEVMSNPITIRSIQQHQFVDLGLNLLHQQEPNQFPTKFVQDRPVICFLPDINNANTWKIALPSSLIQPTI